MRDNSQGMIEVIDAFKEGDNYYSIIEVPKNEQKQKFRIGITLSSYKAIKKILQSRPLNNMPSLKYQYFWDGSLGGRAKENIVTVGFRCETLEDGRTLQFDVPQDFLANLRWFKDLKSFDEAKHLAA